MDKQIARYYDAWVRLANINGNHFPSCTRQLKTLKFTNDQPLIYSSGTQVVSQKDVMAANDRIAHPAGAVGVIVRSPVDRSHAYRVKFSDSFEAAIHHDQLVRLSDFKQSVLPDRDTEISSDRLYKRVISRMIFSLAFAAWQSMMNYHDRPETQWA